MTQNTSVLVGGKIHLRNVENVSGILVETEIQSSEVGSTSGSRIPVSVRYVGECNSQLIGS